jgi:hypothetical protein
MFTTDGQARYHRQPYKHGHNRRTARKHKRVHTNIGRQAITNIEICEVSLNWVFFMMYSLVWI